MSSREEELFVSKLGAISGLCCVFLSSHQETLAIKKIRMKFFCKIVLCLSLGTLFLGTASVSAQSQAQIAGMVQDMQLLRQKMGQLALKVELLEAENERLKTAQQSLLEQQNAAVKQLNLLTATLDTRLQATEARQEAMKGELLAEISRQVTVLANEMQKGLDTVATSVEQQVAATVVPTQPTFDTDFPKEGVTYTVKPGDTLSKIAREFEAKVRDIQNANGIADPSTGLIAGDTIFIPQRN